jgi:predicted cytidylate kinase
MIITISGTPGSGKGTVGKLLAKKLHLRYYSIGGMRRQMAMERGLTLQEFNVLGEKKAFTDKQVDDWQKKLGRTKDNIIVEGRTSFFFIPHSIKLFLRADLNIAAKRIFKDTAHVRQFEASHRYESSRALAHGLRHRIASDSRRYKKYYGLDIFLRRHYDLVVDTSHMNPAQVVNKIVTFVSIKEKIAAQGEKKHNRLLISSKKTVIKTKKGLRLNKKR